MRDLPNIFYFVKVHHCYIPLSSIFVITFITQSCCATVISWKLGRLIALPGMLHASIFSGCDSNIERLDSGWKNTRASIFSAVKAACSLSRVMFVSGSSTTDGIHAPFTVPAACDSSTPQFFLPEHSQLLPEYSRACT